MADNDAAQVIHRMPGFGHLKEPLLHFVWTDLAQPPIAPQRDDALLEVDNVPFARRLRQLRKSVTEVRATGIAKLDCPKKDSAADAEGAAA